MCDPLRFLVIVDVTLILKASIYDVSQHGSYFRCDYWKHTPHSNTGERVRFNDCWAIIVALSLLGQKFDSLGVRAINQQTLYNL